MELHCKIFDLIMHDITTWWVWVPFYLMLAFMIIKNTESVLRISMTLCAIVLCMVFTHITANFWSYPFFANVFSFVTIATLLVRSRLLGIFMSLWAIILCLGKMHFGSYSVWGILIGVAIGVVAAFLCYWLLRYLDRRGDYYTHRRYVSRKLTSTGFSVTDTNPVLTILVLTFIVIVLRSVIVA